MNKAVFLDRDGTLNVDFGYVHNIKHFKLLPGVLYTLKELKQRGYLLIIITNQSGIERGYYTERQYIEFENEIYSFFEDRGVTIDDIFHCPHYITICNCRKPKVELFYKDFQVPVALCLHF